MAIIKHSSSKNSNYNDVIDYLTYQHNEETNTPILDINGEMIPRDEYLIEGINCTPDSFAVECRELNKKYGKNLKPEDVKTHQYIISFDPKDVGERGLTLDKAMELGMEFAKKNFPGHQIIVCAHPDGHSESGNIHVHIVLNSLRKFDIDPKDAPFAERKNDLQAGYKHHLTDDLMRYYKKDLMELCQRESLNQVDLLHTPERKQTEQEYYARRNGQRKNEREGKDTKFKTQKDYIRDAIDDVLGTAKSENEYIKLLKEKYNIEVTKSRGRFSYRHPERKQNITGRALGANYDTEYVQGHIRDNANQKTHTDGRETQNRGQNTQNNTRDNTQNKTWDEDAGKNEHHRPHAYDKEYDYQNDPKASLYIRSNLKLVTNIQTNVKAAIIVNNMLKELPRNRKGEYNKQDIKNIIDTANADKEKYQDEYDSINSKIDDINTEITELLHEKERDYGRINELKAERGELYAERTEVRSNLYIASAIPSQVRMQTELGFSKTMEIMDRSNQIKQLQMMAKTVCWVQQHGYDTLDKLQDAHSGAKSRKQNAQNKYDELNKKLKTVNNEIVLTGKYLSNKAIYKEFLSSANKGKFRKQHEKEINEYESAVRQLKEMHPDGKFSSMKNLRMTKADLTAEKDREFQELRYYQDQADDLDMILENIENIIGDTLDYTYEHEQTRTTEHERTKENTKEKKKDESR